MSTATRYDVFLVHSDADHEAATFLARQLQNAGVRLFLASWHLVPGTARQEGLEDALAASRTCAVILGAGDLTSWDNEVMRAALDERAEYPDFRVIPVVLPGGSLPANNRQPQFLRRL